MGPTTRALLELTCAVCDVAYCIGWFVAHLAFGGMHGCTTASLACRQAAVSLHAEGATALAPELGKWTQLQTLNLKGNSIPTVRHPMLLVAQAAGHPPSHGAICVALSPCHQAENGLGAEAAVALAPELGKLMQLQTLILTGV